MRLVLLAPFVAALIALSVRSRLTALIIFFGYLSIEGTLKLLANYHPVVHIGADIVLWSMVGLWTIVAVMRRQAAIPKPPLFYLILLHVVWVVLLVFSPYTASLFVGAASLKIHISMIPVYFLTYLLMGERDSARKLMRGLVIFWTDAVAVTILQYAGGPGSLFDLGSVYMNRLQGFHEWRPFGTTALPGGEAVFAFVAVPFALCLVLRGDYRLKNRIILASLVTGLTVFYISGVRQLFLGMVITIVIMFGLQLMRGRGRAIGTFISLAMVGVLTFISVREYLLPQVEKTLAQSIGTPEIWKEKNTVERFSTLLKGSTYVSARTGGLTAVIERVKEFPLGAGLGRTGSAAGALKSQLSNDPLGKLIQEKYGFQDNFFAAMLVETGIPGTLFLTLILLGAGGMGVRLALRADNVPDSALGSLVAGYCTATLVMSWGSQPLLSNPTIAFFWLLSGMAARRLHESKARTAQPVSETLPERREEEFRAA